MDQTEETQEPTQSKCLSALQIILGGLNAKINVVFYICSITSAKESAHFINLNSPCLTSVHSKNKK